MRALLSITCLLLLPLLSPRLAAAAELIVYMSRTPVMTEPDGSMAIPVRLWAERLGREAGVSLTPRFVDIGRSLDLVQSRDDACAIGIVRTPRREDLVDWIGAMMHDRVVLAGRADDAFNGDVDGLDAEAGGSVAASDGFMAGLLVSRNIRFLRVANHAAAIRLLEEGKVRFVVTSMKQLERSGTATVRRLADLSAFVAWFVCGRTVPDAVRDGLRGAHARLARVPEMAPVWQAFTTDGLIPAPLLQDAGDAQTGQ